MMRSQAYFKKSFVVADNLTLSTQFYLSPLLYISPTTRRIESRKHKILKDHPHFRLTKIFSSSSLVMRRWGLVGLSVGLPYNLLLMAYSLGLSSHLTLNHQSHTNTAWLNWVPFGQRNVAWRPSMSQ